MDSRQAAHHLWLKLFQWDLKTVRELHHFIANSPVQPFLDQLVSAHPLKDISLITWCAFLILVYDHGLPLLWIAGGNLCFAAGKIMDSLLFSFFFVPCIQFIIPLCVQ